jgi:hypothetical protein
VTQRSDGNLREHDLVNTWNCRDGMKNDSNLRGLLAAYLLRAPMHTNIPHSRPSNIHMIGESWILVAFTPLRYELVLMSIVSVVQQ